MRLCSTYGNFGSGSRPRIGYCFTNNTASLLQAPCAVYSPCKNGGTCLPTIKTTVNYYSCKCVFGYTGKNCEAHQGKFESIPDTCTVNGKKHNYVFLYCLTIRVSTWGSVPCCLVLGCLDSRANAQKLDCTFVDNDITIRVNLNWFDARLD